MPSHKFRVGETVMVKPAFSRNVPGGAYELTKQLPHNGREFEYRIKSASEEHERVALESELTKDSGDRPVATRALAASPPIALGRKEEADHDTLVSAGGGSRCSEHAPGGM